MEKINCAVVGCGVISELHIEAIINTKDAVLFGVYDNNFERASMVAKQHNCRAFKTLDEVLNCKEIDIVCICTPSFTHSEIAIESLKRDKNVFVEKPIAISREQINKLLFVSKSSKGRVASVFQGCFSNAALTIKSMLQREEFGHIKEVKYILKTKRDKNYFNSATWRGKIQYEGGGALMNQGIHGIAFLHYLFGDFESVQANYLHELDFIDVETSINGKLKFKNGITGSFFCTTQFNGEEMKRIEIIGEKTSIIVEGNKIISNNNDYNLKRESKVIDFDYFYHQKQLLDLIDSIRNNHKPLLDETFGCEVVNFVLDAYKSCEKNGVIVVNENN